LRVFLDTNVLVSAFATRGLCADVLRHVLAEHELLTGEVVLAELRRALREKLHLAAETIQEIDALLRAHHVEPKPERLPVLEIRDEDDLSVLASALAGFADVLVTGDKDLLGIAPSVRGLRIVNPRGFWALTQRRRRRRK
jgi:uncharacterized protein